MKKEIEIPDMILKMLSNVTPGTSFREGLDNIVDANTGGFIIVGLDKEVEKILDGGFYVNCDYTPQRIYELAKMDGAIVLNEDLNKILYASIHVQASKKYSSDESGTRHRSAQRAAKQTKKLVIAISERRNTITLYKENIKYKLRNINVVMAEATQAIKTFERYIKVLSKEIGNLTIMEYDDFTTFSEVTSVLKRYEMLYRIKVEIKHYIAELGSEGRLISLQLEELIKGMSEEREAFLKDYFNEKEEFNIEKINFELNQYTDEELLENENLLVVLGHGRNISILDNNVKARGYRLLGKISRLNKKDIENIIRKHKDLTSILEATIEELSEIEKISKVKARAIQRGLARIKTSEEFER